MSFAAITSAICACAFAALFLFTLARGQASREGRFILAASAATVLWAIASATGIARGAIAPLETVQALIWLALLEWLLRPQSGDTAKRGARGLAVVAGALACAAALAN